jgi:lipoprotein NlpD
MNFRSLALALALIVAACETAPPRAPVSERTPARPKPIAKAPAPEVRADLYSVKKGDTLYSIAQEHSMDYRELAAMNNMTPATVLRIGQQLKIKKPAAADSPVAAAESESGVTTAPLSQLPPVVGAAIPVEAQVTVPVPPPAGLPPSPASPPEASLKTQPKAAKLPYSDRVLAELQAVEPRAQPEALPPVIAKIDPKPEAAEDDGEDAVNWGWPAQGKILSSFSESAKGVDIAGKAGQPVLATAAGKVVYSGTGLRGYGKLIIIKHNKTYLSAYAHNKEIFVKEGDAVNRGQKIAEMGDSDSDQVKLHFEIRRQGKPVDPLRYLPAEKASRNLPAEKTS